MNHYEKPSHVSKTEAARLLVSADPDAVVSALLGAALEEPDRAWVEAQCHRALQHDDLRVRRAAIQAVGHVARVHRALDPKLVAALRALSKDRALGGAVSDALDDLDVFLRRS